MYGFLTKKEIYLEVYFMKAKMTRAFERILKTIVLGNCYLQFSALEVFLTNSNVSSVVHRSDLQRDYLLFTNSIHVCSF